MISGPKFFAAGGCQRQMVDAVLKNQSQDRAAHAGDLVPPGALNYWVGTMRELVRKYGSC